MRSDGVLAVNKLPLSFPGQLYDKHLAEHSVALCLAKAQGFFAGYIVFGFPFQQLEGRVPWVPFERDKGGAYVVEFYNIKYGDEPALLGELAQYEMNGQVRKCKFNITMDGSSRFTYLTNEIFVPFVNLVKKWAKKHGYELQIIEEEEGTCWSFWKTSVTEAELIQGFSNITFLLQSPYSRERMFVKPENFLISPKVWCALQFEVLKSLEPTSSEVWQ